MNAGRLWAGGVATAVVAALIAVMALATVVGAVLPFTTNGPRSAQVTTAAINAVIGVAIWSLVDHAGRRSLVPDLR